MEISISEQLIALASFLIVGFMSGLLYSLLEVIHSGILFSNKPDNFDKLSKITDNIFRFVSDLLFFIIITAVFSLTSYTFSYGKLRLLNIVAFSVGFAICVMFPGKMLIVILRRPAHLFRSFIIRSLRLMIYPIVLLYKLFVYMFKFVYIACIYRLVCMIKRKRNKRKTDRVIESLSVSVKFDL